MAKIPHQRDEGQVRGWAELVEGTTMRFHCPAGHSWTEDLNRKALPISKRVGASGCRFYASWWSKAKGGVTVVCKACRRAQLRQSHDTVKDVTGSGYERWTCRSCASTCLRDPYMSDAQWNAKLQAWRAEHPARVGLE